MADFQNMIAFFLDRLPDFLLSDPIKYFTAFALLGFAVGLILRIKKS